MKFLSYVVFCHYGILMSSINPENCASGSAAAAGTSAAAAALGVG